MTEHVFRVRPYQRAFHEAWANGTSNRLIEIAHRRWGKDEVALNVTRTKALQRPFLGLFTDEKRECADTTTIYPDFMKICEGFGVPSRRVIHKKDLREAMEWFLAEKGACILEVMVPYTEHVLPMIPAGATYKDVITEGMTTLKAGDGL